VNEETLETGLETVEVELSAETLAEIDDRAFVAHRGNRGAAVSDLLDEWLKTRADETAGDATGEDATDDAP
jgi:hypothetical protein